MSKAFTREDDLGEEPVLRRQLSTLPPGVKNYMTAAGAQRLRDEVDFLTNTERSRVAALSKEGETSRELQTIDQRIVYLQESLQSAEIVPAPADPDGPVRFGATVLVRDKAGEQTEYRIVGIDETDTDRDWVSWRSPIARALLNARVGQKVKFKVPAGEQELEIVKISYAE